MLVFKQVYLTLEIVLSWKNEKHIRQEKICSYQVWIFNEGESRILNRWEPMKDDIKAISSTMACEIPMVNKCLSRMLKNFHMCASNLVVSKH